MPIPTIPKSLYPLVPNSAGVPALLRSSAQILDTITLGKFGFGDMLDDLIGAEPVKWGVFHGGTIKIAEYDSVFAIGHQSESHISDYPLELGAFASYNKIQIPFDVTVTLNCGGSETQRATFLSDLEDARSSLNLYSVMTPERTYENVNFTSLNIQRSVREGAHMIIAQLIGREVREKASAAYSKPKDPAAYEVRAQGQVQIISDPTFDATGVA
jgi:hypothetical protein